LKTKYIHILYTSVLKKANNKAVLNLVAATTEEMLFAIWAGPPFLTVIAQQLGFQ
jgi:hypothetical protein